MSSLISFGLPEVRDWAAFSNDYNPIHFDVAQAKSAGLEGLVVHGMLALLPVKVATSTAYAVAADADPAARWLKFHALFRSPIPHASANELTIRPSRSRGCDFRLRSREDQQERFRGSLSPASDQSTWLRDHPVPSSRFSNLKAEDSARFAACYADVRQNWIALDAIIFADFMRSRLSSVADSVQRELTAISGGASGVGLFVQSSHSVHIDVSALQSLGPLPIDCDQLSYGMAAPDLVVNPDKLIGSVSLPVLCGGRLIMLIEIGLLAKPSVNYQ